MRQVWQETARRSRGSANSEEERRLFRKLAIFAGSWTVEAASTLTKEEPKLLDQLTSLVEKNLLHREITGTHGLRLSLLRLWRVYGYEQFQHSAEYGETQHLHACYFLHLAEQAEPRLHEPESAEWLADLELERENLQHALRYWQQQGATNQILRLVSALRHFWRQHEQGGEVALWLTEALAMATDIAPLERARATLAAGMLTHTNYTQQQTFLQSSLHLFQDLQDLQGLAEALNELGDATSRQGHLAEASLSQTSSLAIWQKLANPSGVALTTLRMARILHVHQNKLADALRHAEAGLALARQIGNREATAHALYLLANIRWRREHPKMLRPLLAESLALYKEIDQQQGVALVMRSLFYLALLEQQYSTARTLLEESLQMFLQQENKAALIENLKELARLSALDGQVQRSIHLLGASDALRETIGRPPYSLKNAYDYLANLLATPLSEELFTVNWQDSPGPLAPTTSRLSHGLHTCRGQPYLSTA